MKSDKYTSFSKNRSSEKSGRTTGVVSYSSSETKMSSSLDLEEKGSLLGDEALEKANVSDISKHKSKKVCRETDKVAHPALVSDSKTFTPKIVKLNVGGQLFSTSLETLTSDTRAF